MREQHTITSRLKPFLQEFLTSFYGNPPVASLNTWLGTAIYPYLSVRPRHAVPAAESGEECFTIALVNYDRINVRNGTVWMSPKHQRMFQELIRKTFFWCYYQYMLDKTRYDILVEGKNLKHGQIKNCIYFFCLDYNIPMHRISFDMLKQSFFRYRRALDKDTERVLKQNKFNQNLSPFRPLILSQL
jgi:hypothetical protein